mgnify:CR=1 FL=1
MLNRFQLQRRALHNICMVLEQFQILAILFTEIHPTDETERDFTGVYNEKKKKEKENE